MVASIDKSSNNRIVSIVDDDIDIAVLFRDALKSITGITVFTFTNPILALEHFESNSQSYVLVISDLRMPEMNGIELLTKMKESNKFMRTILMTAFEIEDKMFNDYKQREIINSFIQKPIKMHDLVKEVDIQLHCCEEHNEIIFSKSKAENIL